jgi:hypothetical protein
MALGLGDNEKSLSEEQSGAEKQTGENFGTKNYYDGFAPGDASAAEAQQTTKYRKGSRIDRPVTKSIAGNMREGRKSIDGTIDEGEVTVGKQLEAEAGNAIQYRTCSWQKV